MQGTILILDGVATNRIMLKVQLSAAYYHVIQADRLAGIDDIIRRSQPDLILAASRLPDGTAGDLAARLARSDAMAAIPLVVVTPQNDRAGRLAALAAGADDSVSQPLDDVMLRARIRRLIRVRNQTEELRPRDGMTRALGLAEPMAGFAGAARIALMTRNRANGALWRRRLAAHVSHPIRCLADGDIHREISEGFVPDAIVISLSRAAGDPDLRLLADLRTRNATRHAAILAVAETGDHDLAAQALDLGADDVLQDGFCAEELALRLARQLQIKHRSDRMRDTLRDGLRAAVRDPLTGLYNRRYALPHLARVARNAAETGRGFAVMLADLDHFKRINDRYGHPVGDAVLTETARRLRSLMRPGDMLARVGGEEFLIVLEDIDSRCASQAAERLCRQIDGRPLTPEGCDSAIAVTVSIGVVVGPVAEDETHPDSESNRLIHQADRALYEAKDAGRNQITLVTPAA